MLVEIVLGQVSIAWMYGFLGVFIAFSGFVYNVTRNSRKDMEKKADRVEVIKLEKEMRTCEKTKASIEYVDDKTSALHHRITDAQKNTSEKLDLILQIIEQTNTNVTNLINKRK